MKRQTHVSSFSSDAMYFFHFSYTNLCLKRLKDKKVLEMKDNDFIHVLLFYFFGSSKTWGWWKEGFSIILVSHPPHVLSRRPTSFRESSFFTPITFSLLFCYLKSFISIFPPFTFTFSFSYTKFFNSLGSLHLLPHLLRLL